VTFLYKLTSGIAHRSYGYEPFEMANFSLNVARLANLPAQVIDVAGEKSRSMEEETNSRERDRWFDISCSSNCRAEKARQLLKHVDLDTVKELARRLE
jgi:DNA mismatch repair ATPase MutS